MTLSWGFFSCKSRTAFGGLQAKRGQIDHLQLSYQHWTCDSQKHFIPKHMPRDLFVCSFRISGGDSQLMTSSSGCGLTAKIQYIIQRAQRTISSSRVFHLTHYIFKSSERHVERYVLTECCNHDFLEISPWSHPWQINQAVDSHFGSCSRPSAW